MTKKLTPAAIALAEAARKGGAAAVSAMIDEIVKDAPPMPGLAELEAKYGAGKVPMTAVLGSTLLSLKDKKWLFKIAGYKYPTDPVQEKPAADKLDKAKLSKVDAHAFAEFKSVLELAFANDGYRGVLVLCKNAVEQAEIVADNSKARSMTGIAKEVSTFMGAIWPGMKEAELSAAQAGK